MRDLGLLSGNRNVTLVWVALLPWLADVPGIDVMLAASVFPIFMLPLPMSRLLDMARRRGLLRAAGSTRGSDGRAGSGARTCPATLLTAAGRPLVPLRRSGVRLAGVGGVVFPGARFAGAGLDPTITMDVASCVDARPLIDVCATKGVSHSGQSEVCRSASPTASLHFVAGIDGLRRSLPADQPAAHELPRAPRVDPKVPCWRSLDPDCPCVRLLNFGTCWSLVIMSPTQYRPTAFAHATCLRPERRHCCGHPVLANAGSI